MLTELKGNCIKDINRDKLLLDAREMTFIVGQLLKYYSSNIKNRENRKSILKIDTGKDLIGILNTNYCNMAKSSEKSALLHKYILNNFDKDLIVDKDILVLGHLNNLIIFKQKFR